MFQLSILLSLVYLFGFALVFGNCSVLTQLCFSPIRTKMFIFAHLSLLLPIHRRLMSCLNCTLFELRYTVSLGSFPSRAIRTQIVMLNKFEWHVSSFLRVNSSNCLVPCINVSLKMDYPLCWPNNTRRHLQQNRESKMSSRPSQCFTSLWSSVEFASKSNMWMALVVPWYSSIFFTISQSQRLIQK